MGKACRNSAKRRMWASVILRGGCRGAVYARISGTVLALVIWMSFSYSLDGELVKAVRSRVGRISSDTIGIIGYLSVVGLSLVVQKIDEGWSVWTLFKLGLDVVVLVLALLLVRGRPAASRLRQAASWTSLLAAPWIVSIVVEPAFVVSLSAEAFQVAPHVAFHLLISGGYALGIALLLPFVAMRPLRRGDRWGAVSLVLVALAVILSDSVAAALVYTDPAHVLGHLLAPILLLAGAGLSSVNV